MNYSWLNNSSQNSTGFMYYSLDTTPVDDNKEKESTEFLQLNECAPSPQGRKFNPTNFSSPYHSRRGNPRNFNKRNKNRQNTSYNSSSSYNNMSQNNSFSNNSRNNSFCISNYLHPTFMEDPWAALEKQLDCQQTQEQLNVSEELNQSSPSTAHNISSGGNKRYYSKRF